MKLLIKADLSTAIGFFSITCDGWQSNSLNNYLGVTCHFINKELEMKHRTLALKYLEDSKTAIYLKDMINACLSEWGIQTKACL